MNRAPTRAASLLADARRRNTIVEDFPRDLIPSSLAEAYALQDDVRSALGFKVAGWKTGATAAAVQARFGVSEPFAGPVLAPYVHQSPAALPARDFPHRIIESEFAFHFARPLPARREPYTRAVVLAAVEAVVPAIEVVGPRLPAMPFDKPMLAIADCGVNAALVLGTPATVFNPLSLPKHAVRLLIDGEVRAEGTGEAVLGDPVKSLVWTANHLSQRGIGIAAGDVLTTGTATGIVTLEPGQAAVADFGTLGTVELRFA